MVFCFFIPFLIGALWGGAGLAGATLAGAMAQDLGVFPDWGVWHPPLYYGYSRPAVWYPQPYYNPTLVPTTVTYPRPYYYGPAYYWGPYRY